MLSHFKFIKYFSCLFFALSFIFAGQGVLCARDYESFGPFDSRIQNPIYLQNLWLTPRRAEVLPEGTFELSLNSAFSNLFEKQNNANYALNLDMEVWRPALSMEYGITRDFEIGIEIPFFHTSGGFLDSFIQKFHKAFGLPNGGRDQVQNGLFRYQLASGGADLFDYSSTKFGLGDITLRFKNQFAGEDSDWPALAWFADLKFPTGSKSHGIGSGAPDFGLGVALDASWKRLHGYVNTAYYVIGGNSDFENLMHSELFAFMIAGEVSIIPTLSVLVQLQGGTPMLKGTGLENWDGVPMDLVVGFRGEERDVLGELGDLVWQFGFAEDITSRGPSIDFTVYASVGFRFDLFDRSRPSGDWLALRSTNHKP